MTKEEKDLVFKLSENYFSLENLNLTEKETSLIDKYFLFNLLRGQVEYDLSNADEDDKKLIDKNVAILLNNFNFSPSSIMVDRSSLYDFLFKSDLVETFKTLINEGLWSFKRPEEDISNEIYSLIASNKKEKQEFFMSSPLVNNYFKKDYINLSIIFNFDAIKDDEFFMSLPKEVVDFKELLINFLPEENKYIERIFFELKNKNCDDNEKLNLVKEMINDGVFVDYKLKHETKERNNKNASENINFLTKIVLHNDLAKETVKDNRVKLKSKI